MIIKMKKEILDRMKETKKLLVGANSYEQTIIEERIQEIRESYLLFQRIVPRGKGRYGYHGNMQWELV